MTIHEIACPRRFIWICFQVGLLTFLFATIPTTCVPIQRSLDNASLPPEPHSPVTMAETTRDPVISRRFLSDTTTLSAILQQGGYLTQLDSWKGKLLFVKVDETTNIHQFRSYYYQSLYEDKNQNGIVDPGDEGFFNPASTVKVAIAALVLEQLNQMGLARESEYKITGTSGWTRIDEDIRRMLVISDNESTNRLILFLGFDRLNNTLKAKNLSNFAVNRLMLDRGTMVESPAFELNFNGQTIEQQSQNVQSQLTCFETDKRVGNCSTAIALIEVLARIVQPYYFTPQERFAIEDSDRIWLEELMSHTPQQEGFNYADNYCRFLTHVQQTFARQSGRMLSKCGVAVFSKTYVDTSFLETDAGQKYYLAFAVTPSASHSETEILQWMNAVTTFILPRLP